MVALSIERPRPFVRLRHPIKKNPPLRANELHEVCRVRGAGQGVDAYQQKGKTNGDQEPHRGFSPALAETIWQDRPFINQFRWIITDTQHRILPKFVTEEP